VDSVSRVTNSFVKSLAEVLRIERERQELSQTELAARAGLSQPHIGYIERGKRAPTVESLKRIALAMGKTATELVGMAEDNASKGIK
jgi:transcriptional regulator with XRE-family HTH domain